ncbi:MAG: retropepsin-like aspartic protease, partial [Rhizomicrobium sp.]
MRKWGICAAIAGLLYSIAISCAAAEEAKCQLVRFYSWPMTLNAVGHLTIPVPINGQPVNMLVDTGSFYSILTRTTADQLHLPVQANPRAAIEMFGGEKSNLMATAKEVMIGPVALHDRPFFILSRNTDWYDGILGAEILRIFDVDFDFAGGKLNLYSQEHCPGKINYWSHTTPAI